MAEQAAPVAETASGTIVGARVADGVDRFLGIPYAEAPVGPRRFAEPEPRAPWADVLEATAYGPTAPQPVPSRDAAALLPDRRVPGDDILNLNVWAPTERVAGGRPVMVFVHGGSWTSGSGSNGGYDGARFARDGVVLVTINYRLGVDGFLWFGDGPANLGILDQIRALEWVRDHIGAFGGDPANVTVFGESAGGMSIGALLAMPAAAGLLHRAIMQSGATFHAIDPDSARLVGTRLAAILDVEPTREAVASVSQEALLAAQTQVGTELVRRPRRALWGQAGINLLPFEPVVDGSSLPRHPIDAVRDGHADDVDVLVGWNAEEANLFFVPAGTDRLLRWVPGIFARRFEAPRRIAREYVRRAGRDHAVSALTTDFVYRMPALHTATAHPRAWVYEFAWRSPAFDGRLGASHVIELPFVFDALDHDDWAPLLGGAAPQSVADEVHRAWIEFATTGDPGWDRYRADHRAVRRFDVDSATSVDPEPWRRHVWDGVR